MGAAHLVLRPDHVRVRVYLVQVTPLARSSSFGVDARKPIAGLKKKKTVSYTSKVYRRHNPDCLSSYFGSWGILGTKRKKAPLPI